MGDVRARRGRRRAAAPRARPAVAAALARTSRCRTTRCCTSTPCWRTSRRRTPGCAGWSRPASGGGRWSGCAGRVTEIARGLARDVLDAGADGSTVDLLPLYAEPLPVAVIATLLGVPDDDRGLLRPWSNAIVKLYEPSPPVERRRAAEAAAAEYVAYVRGLIELPAPAPGRGPALRPDRDPGRGRQPAVRGRAGRDRGAAADGRARGERQRRRQRDLRAAHAIPASGPG